MTWKHAREVAFYTVLGLTIAVSVAAFIVSWVVGLIALYKSWPFYTSLAALTGFLWFLDWGINWSTKPKKEGKS